MSSIKLAVIGAGQLGSRHLQALALFDRKASIQVVDSFPNSLKTAEERFLQVQGSGNIEKVEYLNSISELAENLDVVIIATTSDVRRTVIETLLTHKKVRYLILEKVLFQRIEDYYAISELLKKLQIKAWVNCPRRMWPFYKDLKAMFQEIRKLDVNVSCSQLGIGCNAIHILDLVAYLTGETQINLAADQLDPEAIPGKREGFLEFTGTLYGTTKNGSRFSVTSYPNGDAPLLLQIASEKIHCIIRETEGKTWWGASATGWIWQELSFTVPYQSQLTHLAVEQILDTGNSDLTTYEESTKLHSVLLNSLNSHLQKIKSEEVKICPIT